MKIKFILFISIVSFLWSCDEVEEPFSDGIIQPPEGSKRVLILDFTGHNCAGCPAAAKSASTTAEDYPNNVFVLTVHPDLNGLTTPLTEVEGDPFSTEWRTPEGNLMQAWFNIQFLPFGSVSAIEDNGNISYTFANWRPVAEQNIFDERMVDLEMEIAYDEVSREIEISTDIDYLQDIEGNLNLMLAVVENNIEDWQKNGNGIDQPADPDYTGGDIPDYIHKHILRTHLNGLEGQQVSSGTAASGSSFEYDNSGVISIDYVAEEVSIYAYIYNTETLEILDVVEKHIIE